MQDELVARVAPVDLINARFLQTEATVVERVSVAAELYPDLFTPGVGSVDKDGLMDYRELLRRMKPAQLACSMTPIATCYSSPIGSSGRQGSSVAKSPREATARHPILRRGPVLRRAHDRAVSMLIAVRGMQGDGPPGTGIA